METPQVAQTYCYVVESQDGNPYNIGVFMTFESLIKYFKSKENLKFSDSITEPEFIDMCERVFIIVDKMKVFY